MYFHKRIWFQPSKYALGVSVLSHHVVGTFKYKQIGSRVGAPAPPPPPWPCPCNLGTQSTTDQSGTTSSLKVLIDRSGQNTQRDRLATHLDPSDYAKHSKRTMGKTTWETSVTFELLLSHRHPGSISVKKWLYSFDLKLIITAIFSLKTSKIIQRVFENLNLS